MKTTARNTLVVVSAAALVGLSATAQAISAPTGKTTTTTASVTATDLESGLAEDLQFTREEERMARDLYAALADVHDGARPMSRITHSEQQHFDRVGALLDQYDIDDPSEGLPSGTYAFPALQDLYDGWFEDGKASLDAAYQVGIELEERDVADLQALIADTDAAEVDAVLERLLAASKHHLAAFTADAEGTLPTEPGQSRPGMQNRGPGQGWGPGQGRGQRQGPGAGEPMGPGGAQGQHDCPFTATSSK